VKQTNVALLIAILTIASVIVYIEGSKIIPPEISSQIPTQFKEGIYPKAPELVGISGVLNADSQPSIDSLRGKVVLIDFWTYTCINCIRTLPFLVDWDAKYKDKGLVIIGVHTPEFEFEKEYDNVREAMDEYGIEYIVVQDNDYATWRAYSNRFWPHKYLIDTDGFVRYDHIGEGGYQETEKQIQLLLSEIGDEVSMPVSDIEDRTPRIRTTPELYAGFAFAIGRAQNVGNAGGLVVRETSDYVLPESIRKDVIYLEGLWQSNEDHLLSVDKASILLDYTANLVHIVAEPINGPVELLVLVDGSPISQDLAGPDVVDGIILIDSSRLYTIVDGAYGNHVLTLTANQSGFTFNAFTFG